MIAYFKGLFQEIRNDFLKREMIRYFDWPLLLIVLFIALFGIVCVFSATSSEVTQTPATIMEMLETQSVYYPRLQFFWLLAGLIAMGFMLVPPFDMFNRHSAAVYMFNVGMLLFTLILAEAGRGNMQAFVKIGSSERGFQPSEFGKVFMIMCFSSVFTQRAKPVSTFQEFMFLVLYMVIPLVLIILQPDFGTALVYVAVFCVMIFVSGTDGKLLWSMVLMVVLLGLTVWFAMNNTSASENFRLTRFLIWLDPESYPDEARQVINAQIAVGSGGIYGKGIVSPGSFASLGYISDDHTDFIFAVVCESFGMIGGIALVAGYILLIARLIYLAFRTDDAYGAFLIIGVMGMLLFHIIENICMVIGLLPVTGIPLPFVSYGGSNMLTNMVSIGVVQNVVIRTRSRAAKNRTSNANAIPI